MYKLKLKYETGTQNIYNVRPGQHNKGNTPALM